MSGFRVFQLSVTAAAGVKFKLASFPAAAPFWSVETTTPAVGALELTRGTDKHSSWTCSYEASRTLDSSIAAPAYRIEFAPTEQELTAGKSQSVVIEGNNDGFMRNETAPRELASTVSLGHHNCWGNNFLWETPKVAVRVTALLADGSERASAQIFELDDPGKWSKNGPATK